MLATITALVEHNGLGSSGGPERLLFAGCSAGGRGVLSNLDAVAAAVPSNVQVQGLVRARAAQRSPRHRSDRARRRA